MTETINPSAYGELAEPTVLKIERLLPVRRSGFGSI